MNEHERDLQKLFDRLCAEVFSPLNTSYTKSMREALRSIAYDYELDVSCLEGMHFGDR